MKPMISLTALALSALAVTSASAQPRGGGGGLPPPEAIEHITGNVYKIFGGGGNTLVVVQNDGVVLVDTKMPGNGPAIMTEVKKVTDKPVKVIINTHSHPDHMGSTDYIREQYPDVKVISSEATRDEIAGNKGNKPGTIPNTIFKDRLTLGKGADQVELYSFGQAHTGSDTFVYFPASGVLFMGDVMAWNMAPFLPSGGATLLPGAEEKLVASLKNQKVKYVVEGHGYVDTWKDLVRITNFNRDLVTFAKAAYDRGDAPSAAVAQLAKNADYAPLLDKQIKDGLPYGNTPFARANMNVNVAYLEFAGEPIGFGVANGQPLPATAKHKGSDPADTAAPPAGSPVKPRPPIPTVK
ncbi:MAG: MBL fold metallo-hydrolase [Sphingobium sp.]|nr:MBL fold metallo-hydrolase [Sphingobium sp.]